MGTIIGLSDILRTRITSPQDLVSHSSSVSSFTPRDRVDLKAWSRGGRRAEFCSTDMGVFATLYEDGRSWASWGVVRQSRSILLWDCVTHADVDRFATMVEALAAIAADGEQDFVENVVHFTARQAVPAYQTLQHR